MKRCGHKPPPKKQIFPKGNLKLDENKPERMRECFVLIKKKVSMKSYQQPSQDTEQEMRRDLSSCML